MIRLGVRSLGAVGAPEGFPGHGAWPKDSRIRSLIGGSEAVTGALHTHYAPLRLRRLDPYAGAALLAAKLALEACPCLSREPGLVVCTGRGPVPAINAFTDSYMDFGPEGASPTAFSQTVHNVAASTISMFLTLEGPALTVSQPGLGVSSALCTISAWLEQGLVETVLFGAVDDCEAFSRVIEERPELPATPHSPLAVFAVLSWADADEDLLDVEAIRFSARQGGDVRQTRCPGPVEILSGLLSVLSAGGREAILEEAYGGSLASLRVRIKAVGGL